MRSTKKNVLRMLLCVLFSSFPSFEGQFGYSAYGPSAFDFVGKSSCSIHGGRCEVSWNSQCAFLMNSLLLMDFEEAAFASEQCRCVLYSKEECTFSGGCEWGSLQIPYLSQSEVCKSQYPVPPSAFTPSQSFLSLYQGWKKFPEATCRPLTLEKCGCPILTSPSYFDGDNPDCLVTAPPHSSTPPPSSSLPSTSPSPSCTLKPSECSKTVSKAVKAAQRLLLEGGQDSNFEVANGMLRQIESVLGGEEDCLALEV